MPKVLNTYRSTTLAKFFIVYFATIARAARTRSSVSHLIC
ncbi:hypothetical protein HMPREF9078_01001 [Capnocytophaga sp. oral taxon 380 str. F0488]|nr:hypothetical protein HMPREF9078_01001 [Capnocytophaga sp. oral taxon 380 str. F0488]